MLTLFGKIAQHLLGTKYYCVTLEQNHDANGVGQRLLSSYIFTTRQQATEFYHRQKYSNRSFTPVEIVTFRSRQKYTTHIDAWNYCLNN